MSDSHQPSLRRQLSDARRNIIAQLADLNVRAEIGSIGPGYGPPDYRAVIAERESQLAEINDLLAEGS